jgi:hypothetical protein
MAHPPRLFRLLISVHARERARERFPCYKTARISDEVRIAMAEGRVSQRKPPGVWHNDDPDCLYAWTEDGERVFVLTLDRFDEGGFAVKTVIRASRQD